MGKDFYGFQEEPFKLSPNPKFLYFSSSHYAVLSSILYWIEERKSLMVITGEVGVGKTILLYALLRVLSQQIKTAFIFNPKLDFKGLLTNILRDLGVPIAEKEEDLDSLKLRFSEYLRERPGINEAVTIIIDEAQSLDEEVLEDLGRLLVSVSPATRGLQILLVGQPELEVKLNSERLRFIKDRIAIHGKITPLTREEGRGYIRHRLKMAGRDISEVFTSDAVTRIWSFAAGIPRVMNLICDRALLIGYRASSPIIDSEIAEEAIKDFLYLQPDKPEAFHQIFHHLKSRYKVIGIAFLLVGGFGFLSFFFQDSSLFILKGMATFLPSIGRPVGIVGDILPPEKQRLKVNGKIPSSENRPSEKREEEIKPPLSTIVTNPGPIGGPKGAGKEGAPSGRQAKHLLSAKGYIIQVSAMRDLDLAKKFVEKQKRNGLQMYLTKTEFKDGGVWYKVYIGFFEDRAKASRYMKEENLKEAFPDCFIRGSF